MNKTPLHEARLARGRASYPSTLIPRVFLFIAVLSGAIIAGHISTKAIANLAHFQAHNGEF